MPRGSAFTVRCLSEDATNLCLAQVKDCGGSVHVHEAGHLGTGGLGLYRRSSYETVAASQQLRRVSRLAATSARRWIVASSRARAAE